MNWQDRRKLREEAKLAKRNEPVEAPVKKVVKKTEKKATKPKKG